MRAIHSGHQQRLLILNFELEELKTQNSKLKTQNQLPFGFEPSTED